MYQAHLRAGDTATKHHYSHAIKPRSLLIPVANLVILKKRKKYIMNMINLVI